MPGRKKKHNKVFSLRDFRQVEYPNTQPLIGTEDDALLVSGEGAMFPGTAGVGKTMFINSVAFSAAVGENILKWPTPRCLRVLIVQAELPPPFYQKRLNSLYESYLTADPRRAAAIEENIFIMEVGSPFNISADDESEFEEIGSFVELHNIDIVIIDPFLSFFPENENDNGLVRRALDNLKRCVAERYNCGLIITDHQPKYAGSDKNPEQHHSMRGAGAKRDWAASVIALSKMKTPEGEHGSFICATVDKMRYGKVPRSPFTVRRDDHSFRHTLYRGINIELNQIAQTLDEAGGDLSKRVFNSLVAETFSISDHEARKIIDTAIDENWIVTEQGKRKSIIHNIGERYVEWRDDK